MSVTLNGSVVISESTPLWNQGTGAQGIATIACTAGDFIARLGRITRSDRTYLSTVDEDLNGPTYTTVGGAQQNGVAGDIFAAVVLAASTNAANTVTSSWSGPDGTNAGQMATLALTGVAASQPTPSLGVTYNTATVNSTSHSSGAVTTLPNNNAVIVIIVHGATTGWTYDTGGVGFTEIPFTGNDVWMGYILNTSASSVTFAATSSSARDSTILIFSLDGANTGINEKTISDAISVADNLSRSSLRPRQITDALTLIAEDAVYREYNYMLSDAVDMTDSTILQRLRQRMIADSVTVAELVTGLYVPAGSGGTVNTKQINDAITIADAVTRLLFRTRQISDSVAFNDARLLSSLYTREVTDSMDVVDATVLRLWWTKVLTDQMNLTESPLAIYVPDVLYDIDIRLGSTVRGMPVLGGY